MKTGIPMALIMSAALVGVIAPSRLVAQACKDDEAIAGEFKKGIVEMIETVKKESVEDFQKAYHQKNFVNKLTFSLGALDGLIACLDKAAQDSTASKEEVEAAKVKRVTYSKLKEKIQHDRDVIKATEDAKDAKALIAKVDLST